LAQVETRSTSRRSAECSPIILREGEQVRLAFIPMLVDNSSNPKASVDGSFIYQRKAKSGRWLPIRTVALSTLKAGEEFKLTLHADELRVLVEGIARLYKLYGQAGIPGGSKTFVELDESLAKFVNASAKDLAVVFEKDSEATQSLLADLVRWLATTPGRREVAERLTSLLPHQVPSFSALLGLASVKEALAHWKQNQEEPSEEFWQRSLAERSFVLSQVFAYPIVVIAQKAYVGGKQVTRSGGKEVDFLVGIESTNAIILLEIKTPMTRLLGQEYRGGVFPFSRELSGAIAQVLRYRQLFAKNFTAVTEELPGKLTFGEPRCIVVAGDTSELETSVMRESFELQREQMRGVTVLTYDELFRRLEQLITLLEGTTI